MSRRSSLYVNIPVVDGSLGLRLPRISRQSINLPTTDVKNNMDRLPPLSSCLQVRADLQIEAERMTSDDSETTRAVAVWPNYGTFSREDVSSMISLHEVKRIRVMVKEEEEWFSELENLLIDESDAEKIEEIRKFKDLIWSRSTNDVVFTSQDNEGAVRVRDLCSVACKRWLTDDLLDFLFQMMNNQTSSHHFQVMSEPLMLSQSFRKRVFDVLKEKLNSSSLEFVHFALNVWKCPKTGTVTISRNGNHWTYFSFSATLDEMYYGDSLGLPIPDNFLSLFEPIFELFKPSATKPAALKPLYNIKVMHTPNSVDNKGEHYCSHLCHQAFPNQKCGNICGFNPIFMSALAATHHNIWKTIVNECRPSSSFLRGVSRLINLSESSSLVRVEVISWLNRRQVDISPLILHFPSLPSEVLSREQKFKGPRSESSGCQGRFTSFLYRQ